MKVQLTILLISLCFLIPFHSKAQFNSISGFVKNVSTGEVKKHATVFESVSGIGTITNSDGYYRLLLTTGQQKLEISSPGFNKYTSSFYLRTDTIISVELIPLELTQEKDVAVRAPKPESFNSNDALKNQGNQSK